MHLRGCHSSRKSGENQFLPGHGKSGILHIKSGKIYISESSQRKVKFQVNVNSFILFGPPFMMTDYGTFLFWFSTSLDVLV